MKNYNLKREFIRHPLKTTVELGKLFALSKKLSNVSGSSLWPNFRRAVYLWFIRRFSREEIDGMGMCLEPFFSAYVPQCLSRRELTKVQESFNPPEYAPFLKNKVMFYQYCRAMGITVPRCFAVYYKDGFGWTADMKTLKGNRQWDDFLTACPAEAIVIKPSPGSGGKGLMAYRRKSGLFCDMQGKMYSAAQVLEYIAHCDTQDGMIIQEYLYNHPDIAAISNVDGRQCARLATFVDAYGKCHILGAFAKFIAGDNVFDNFNDGTSGNILAYIYIDTGIIRTAIMVEKGTRRILTIDKHPQTQRKIQGIRLPYWDAACTLAHRAATAFLPVRTVCWDMIIGPEGPCIIEGNIWWGPTFNMSETMRSMTDRMYAGMKQ